MDRDRFERVREVFERVSAAPPDRCDAVLDDLCAGDEQLRAEVSSLLEAGGAALGGDHPFDEARIEAERRRLDALLDERAATSTGAGAPGAGGAGPTLAPGTSVGSFIVERLIGMGGMGAVYAATQQRPRRTVAIKLIRAGAATEQAMRRFELEAEVLGRLDHPGVARVYEAGVARVSGALQAYVAMEFVQGEPVDRYAKRRQLDVRARLALLACICDAVEHAHQKGVIHRDLKPGNILVREDGTPAVLDFGVARATDADIQLTTMHTDVGALIGTLPYMSPEQASGDPARLDTRSDVYALGVLAYELIAGRLPHDLSGKLIHEAVRVICEEEAPTLASVNRTLRGDIATIVGKALEKDADRRYQSAAEFGADIRRYLADEPVEARPPSAAYQLRKFARRNTALVGGVAGVFVVLVAGVIATSVASVRAVRARDDALAALDQRDVALAIEQEKTGAARETINFFIDVLAYIRAPEFGSMMVSELRAAIERGEPGSEVGDALARFDALVAGVDPAEPATRVIKALIVDRGIEAAREKLGDYPRTQSWALVPLAYNAEKLGYTDEAIEVNREIVAIRESVLGDLDPDTITAKMELVRLLTGASRFEEAHEILSGIDTSLEAIDGLDEKVAMSIVQPLGIYFYEQRRHEEAERYLRLTVEFGTTTRGQESPEVMGARSNLANVLRKLGRLDESLALYEEILEFQERTEGPGSQIALVSRANLSMLLLEMGRADDAETMIRDVIERGPPVFGSTSWIAGNLKAKLASVLVEMGRFAEAERELLDGYRMHADTLGDAHHRTREVFDQVADLYERWEQAEPGAGHGERAARWRESPGAGG